MSYSFTAGPAEKADVHDALVQVVEAQPDPTVEQSAHYEAVIEAASRLAAAVGRDLDDLAVTVSGHTNPGHAPAEGWADEFVTVTVVVRR